MNEKQKTPLRFGDEGAAIGNANEPSGPPYYRIEPGLGDGSCYGSCYVQEEKPCPTHI